MRHRIRPKSVKMASSSVEGCMRILMVEDDVMIGEAVLVALKDVAYAVDWISDGITAASLLKEGRHDAVLLDLALPGIDGLELLRQIRQRGDKVPVIIITARHLLQDRVKGLDLGADDYLSKPFEVGELVARLRAVLRRRGGQAGALLDNGVVSLDPATREARRGAIVQVLSTREFALLRALLLRPGRIFGRAELEQGIYSWGEEVESNAVEFLIHGVRKKLGADVIRNVRGFGWMVDSAK
jgi:two-component system OmpR family response regulator